MARTIREQNYRNRPSPPTSLNCVVNYSRKPRRNDFREIETTKLTCFIFFLLFVARFIVNEFRGKMNKYRGESRFGVDVSFVSVCRPRFSRWERSKTYDRQSFIFFFVEDKTKISASIPREGGESFRVKGGGNFRTVR